MRYSLKSINDEAEAPFDVKGILFLAFDLNGYTCGSIIDSLAVSRRVVQQRFTGDGPTADNIRKANLDKVMQLCCSSAEQLEGAVYSSLPPEGGPVRGQKRNSEAAGLADIHDAASNAGLLLQDEEINEEIVDRRLREVNTLETVPVPLLKMPSS